MNRNEVNMLQSLSSLVVELARAKGELRESFETRNAVTEEQNRNNGNLERMGKRTKVLLSNLNMSPTCPPREKPSCSNSLSSAAV